MSDINHGRERPGTDRKVHTEHHSLLLSNRQQHVRACEHQNWTTEKWKKHDELCFFYISWMAKCMCVTYLRITWHQDALWEEDEPAEAG